MHLIAPLAAGIRGAESGSVQVYRRGTSTEATCYSDFEGASLAVDASYTLDANGRAILYVNELVTVVVVDTSGSTVTTFTAGESAAAVEYRGQSFTGTHYTTGASAAGNPTTLQAILDKWKDSAGATNFQVLINGAAADMDQALGVVAAIAYNVKAYGALGDGSTNDTVAIQAAIDAAEAADGGVVFFPVGEYVVAGLTLDCSASLVGAHPLNTVLLGSSASTTVLTVSGSVTGTSKPMCRVHGLTFRNLIDPSTADLVIVDTDARVWFSDCLFEGQTEGSLFDTDTGDPAGIQVRLTGCIFKPRNGPLADYVFKFSSAGAGCRAEMTRCAFVLPATVDGITTIISGYRLHISDCYFDASACTSGSFSWVSLPNVASVINGSCYNSVFTEGGGATIVSAISITNTASGSKFVEAGNVFGVTPYQVVAGMSNAGYDVQLLSREQRVIRYSSNATSLSVDSLGYGMVYISRSGTAALTIAPSVAVPAGAALTVVVENNGGGASGTIVLDSTVCKGGGAGAAVSNAQFSIYRLRAFVTNALAVRWAVEAKQENVA